MRNSVPLVLVLSLLVAAAAGQTPACTDADYCSGRGTASTDSSGNCQCTCTPPYNGFRCVFSYETNATVDCTNSYYSQSQLHCEAASTCYWNATASACAVRQQLERGTTVEAEGVPWCFNAFPLPFIMIVYAIATVAFGFCSVSVIYLGRYYDVFSRVEDSGERVFNQFYMSTSPYVVYSALVVLSSGILAVTSWINLNQSSDCTYVFFVYVYLIVQFVPVIVIPLYYLIVWIIRKCARTGDFFFVLDDHIAPKTDMALDSMYNNQVRCF